jgi:hypothetical protein
MIMSTRAFGNQRVLWLWIASSGQRFTVSRWSKVEPSRDLYLSNLRRLNTHPINKGKSQLQQAVTNRLFNKKRKSAISHIITPFHTHTMDRCYHSDCFTPSGVPKSLRPHMWGKGSMTLGQVMELCKTWHPQMTERDVIKVMSSDIERDWLKSRWIRTRDGSFCHWTFLWTWCWECGGLNALEGCEWKKSGRYSQESWVVLWWWLEENTFWEEYLSLRFDPLLRSRQLLPGANTSSHFLNSRTHPFHLTV